MRYILLVILFCGLSKSGWSQKEGSFTMELSQDTVLLGDYFSLQYTIENLDGDFVAPDLSQFRVISGPNMSSQYAMINGVVTQHQSYGYQLMPMEEGVYKIDAAQLKTNDGVVKLDDVSIVVKDDPNGSYSLKNNPQIYRKGLSKKDTLSTNEKLMRAKLKKGKKHKI